MAEAMGDQGTDLDSTEIHEILSNQRRKWSLEYLNAADGPLTVTELATKVTDREATAKGSRDGLEQSVYVSLLQTHLPLLEELEIVDYDSDTKQVALAPEADDVTVYLETVPKYGIAWSEYYLALSVLGLLIIVAGEVGVPVLSAIGPFPRVSGVFVVILASASYHTISQGSSILDRI